MSEINDLLDLIKEKRLDEAWRFAQMMTVSYMKLLSNDNWKNDPYFQARLDIWKESGCLEEIQFRLGALYNAMGKICQKSNNKEWSASLYYTTAILLSFPSKNPIEQIKKLKKKIDHYEDAVKKAGEISDRWLRLLKQK